MKEHILCVGTSSDHDRLDALCANYVRWRNEGGPPLPGYFGGEANPAEAAARRRGERTPALHVLALWRMGDDLMARVEFQPDALQRLWAGGGPSSRGLVLRYDPEGRDRHGHAQGATLRGLDIVDNPECPRVIAASRQEDDDSDDLQERFVSRVQQTWAALKEAEKRMPVHQRSSWGDAMQKAADDYPDEYQAYLDTVGQ